MNVIRCRSDRLATLLRDQKVATMPQLKSALGTSVTFTVLRKLAPWGYRSSYSHSGTYFTLDSIAQYDEQGLWSYHGIHFSRHGTLLNTAATLVTNAPAGYFTDELDAVVQVATKDALRHLVQQDGLYRGELAGRYLYCAQERRRRQEQWAARQAQQRLDQELQAAIVLFYSLLDEQQRRLGKYALQARLVDPYQLAVTVCHYPTGASKWNPIEHRLFSEMSKHCAGLPFTD